MNENRQHSIVHTIILCLTLGIICSLIGWVIILVSRLILFRRPLLQSCGPMQAFWIGFAPVLFCFTAGPPKTSKVNDYDYIYTAPNKIELVKQLQPCPNEADWTTSHNPIEATWACGIETPQSTPNNYHCYTDEEYPIYVHDGKNHAEHHIFFLSDSKNKIINTIDYGSNAGKVRIKGLTDTGWGELHRMKLPTEYDKQFWFWAHVFTCVVAFLCWISAVVSRRAE